MKIDAQAVYLKVKNNKPEYVEEIHCPLIIKVMADPNKSTTSAFCIEAGVSEHYLHKWRQENPLFNECYLLSKMYAREIWEEEGRGLRELPMIGPAFEYWRMIGWTRFGISKNSRIRLDLNPKSNPNEHYAQLLEQAAAGDFTAGEIKQLMEAVNVGLNTHQVFTLQKEIDQLKCDLATMSTNSNVKNTFTTKGSAQKD